MAYTQGKKQSTETTPEEALMWDLQDKDCIQPILNTLKN